MSRSVDPDDGDRVTWKARQDALGLDFHGDVLEPHEVRFVERFLAAGQTLRWIGRDSRMLPTNDFVWVEAGGIEIELKSTRAAYRTIQARIQRAASKARRRGVRKDNVIVDIGDETLSETLAHELAQYNVRRDRTPITRLWVMTEGVLVEIPLV